MTLDVEHTPPHRDCMNCTYFVASPELDIEGECRRYAPRPRVDALERDSQQDAWWPIVMQGEWCGEFHPAPRAYKKESDAKENN